MAQFVKNSEERDAFIRSIKGQNGKPLFNSASELLEVIGGRAGLAGANEFFTALDNKLITQFVYDMTMYPTFLRQNHFIGEFQYGDRFEHIWQKQNFKNVKPFKKDSYTPTDLTDQGIKLTRTQIVYQNKQNVQISNAIVLTEYLARGAFQPNAIGAFNKLLTVYLGTLNVEIDEFYYNLETKVVKTIKNTYTLKNNTDWPKPSYVTNDTQYQLSYLKQLLNKMLLPTRGKYSLIGKTGDTNPFSTTNPKAKFVDDDFVPVKLNNITDAFFYVSANLKARFEAFAYSTTFNQEFIRLENRMIVLPLDSAQYANGAEVLDSDPYGKIIKPAFVAEDPETVFLVVKKSFAVADRFKVNISSNWVNGQLVRAIAQFTDYTWLPWNIGLKIKLKLT